MRSPKDDSEATMTKKITIGLARMHVEFGERRDFLPPLVAEMEKRGAQVFPEYDYGSGMGLTERDYLEFAPNAKFVSHEETYQKDIVLVLRCPSNDDIKLLQPGACLISMLHYPTRPQRVELLKSLKINAISLDSIKNGSGQRLIENLRSVAWNGLEAGFHALQSNYPDPGLDGLQRNPIYVTILGAGAVGMHAVQAASRYGDIELWKKMAKRGIPGVQVTAVEYDSTGHKKVMQELLSRTDILVDATQRPDSSQPVIPNSWVIWLPAHAVIVDLSVDPYLLDDNPPVVRGIEGIPQGNLNQYMFQPDDPKWDDLVPESIPSRHRRTTVTCYSWPGVHPKACMRHYGKQLEPLMIRLLRKNYENLSLDGDYFERALYRGTLKAWLKGEIDAAIAVQKGSE
jgi:alanine dehydrogenase